MPTYDNFEQLQDEIKKYLLLQTEYAKTVFVEKLTILLSTLFIVIFVILLAFVVLFYLCFALAYALEPLLGSLALSFTVISVIYLLLIVLLIINRKKFIINPLVRFLSTLFLKNEDEL